MGKRHLESDGKVGERLKELSKIQRKKERFITLRTWLSVIIASVMRDRGTIPANIGNNIFIGNNQYITKNSMSVVFLIKDLSIETPVGFTSKLTKYVKARVPNVTVDFTFKNIKYEINLEDAGMKARIKQWLITMDSEKASDSLKKKVAQLLYTVDIVKSGERLFKSYMYLTLRSNDGMGLATAVNECNIWFKSKNIIAKEVKSDLKTHLEFISLLSDKRMQKLQDIKYNVMSSTTLAETLPLTSGINDTNGLLLGINMLNNSPYFIDLMSSSYAKNIVLYGQSGYGKTFLCQTWLIDAFATGWNICCMDVKGTEFKAFTNACDGVIISFRPESTYYINVFKLNKNSVEKNDSYYQDMMKLARTLLQLIADYSNETFVTGEALIDKILSDMYMSLGVIENNPNTWDRTSNLTAYKVYDYIEAYLSPQVIKYYGEVAERLKLRSKLYLSKTGTYSYMFRDEYTYEDILAKKVISFDFGILHSNMIQDETSFKIKVFNMEIINEDFIRYKKGLGESTLKVLEEVQIVQDFMHKIYAKEFTVRRAQNQATVLLGNSITALADNYELKKAIENTSILVLGKLTETAIEYIVKEYGLEEKRDILNNIATSPDYEYVFYIHNMLQKRSVDGLIKAFVPKRISEGALFKTVDTKEGEDRLYD